MEYQPVKSPIEQGGYLSFRPGERLKKHARRKDSVWSRYQVR